MALMTRSPLKRAALLSAVAVATVGAFTLPAAASQHHPATWHVTGPVRPTQIKGGPWTLGQGPATLGNVTAGYCDAKGRVTSNPGTELFQPAYFPYVTGHGKKLRGLFDYRPKDTDEAVLAADSSDGGRTWAYRGKALELNGGVCPSPALNDDGQGHPTLLTIGGRSYLYTLTRPTADTAGSQLLVHRVDPARRDPLAGLPTREPVGTGARTTVTSALTLPQATIPAAATSAFEIPGLIKVKTSTGVVSVRCTDSTATSFTGCAGGHGTVTSGAAVTTNPVVPATARTTSGLQQPDGILGVLPARNDEVTVLYVQKQLSYFTSPTQPGACTVPFSTLSKIGEGKNKAPLYGNNEDKVTVRSATTRDGIHFKDLGPVNGLGNGSDTTATGLRFVSPSGTVIRNRNGSYGLFFAGGNCYDGDSDGFHFIGYATSKDGSHWKVVNGFTNPLLSSNSTFPKTKPGLYYSGRIYGPQVIPSSDGRTATIVFAGYRTPKPLPKPGTVLGTDPSSLYPTQAGDLASYRTILTALLSLN